MSELSEPFRPLRTWRRAGLASKAAWLRREKGLGAGGEGREGLEADLAVGVMSEGTWRPTWGGSLRTDGSDAPIREAQEKSRPQGGGLPGGPARSPVCSVTCRELAVPGVPVRTGPQAPLVSHRPWHHGAAHLFWPWFTLQWDPPTRPRVRGLAVPALGGAVDRAVASPLLGCGPSHVKCRGGL